MEKTIGMLIEQLAHQDQAIRWLIEHTKEKNVEPEVDPNQIEIDFEKVEK